MSAADNSVPIVETDDDTVMTGEAVALELRPTPFILAAVGALIDWLIYFVGGLLLLVFAVILPLSASSLGKDSATVSIFLVCGIVFVLIVIPTAVELLTRGKSVGRLAVGARIVRADGGAIGFRQAFIRQLLAMLDIYITVGALAAITGLLNSKSQRIGDLLAGTYSQYERVPFVLEPTFGIPPELQGWSTTADVARIPTRVYLRAVKFLRQAREFTPHTRTRLAAQLAGELSAWVSPIPSAPPELFIVGVVALRRERELRARALEKDRLRAVDPTLEALPHAFPRR